MVLRHLAGRTGNTDPVLTLLTQFGGGKTHALTALYHLARGSRPPARCRRRHERLIEKAARLAKTVK